MRIRTAVAIIAAGMLVAAVPVAGGCSKPAGPKGGPLEGVTWMLISYSSSGSMKAPPKAADVQLRFGPEPVTGRKEASGKAVNSYSGPYQATPAGELTIGPIASTLMAGPPELMALEKAYFDALGKTASYSSDGQKLTLYDKDGNALLEFAKSEVSLTGRTWNATGINNGKQAVVSTLATVPVTAQFSTASPEPKLGLSLGDGAIYGNGSVNQYSAPYKLSGSDGITISEITATKKAGSPEAMQQEAEYFAALKGVAKYQLTGSTLELRTADGALAVSYTTAK